MQNKDFKIGNRTFNVNYVDDKLLMDEQLKNNKYILSISYEPEEKLTEKQCIRFVNNNKDLIRKELESILSSDLYKDIGLAFEFTRTFLITSEEPEGLIVQQISFNIK